MTHRESFAGAVLGMLIACSMLSAQPALGPATSTPRPLTDIEKLLGRPPSTEILWRVVDRDLAYGLIDEARRHLAQLVAREDLNEALVLELREKYGPGLLIRLQTYPELAEMARPIVDMLRKGSAEQSLDPKRIRSFISRLDDSPSERAYAIEQLSLAGPHAIPFFIEAFRAPDADFEALLRGLLAMPRSAWPAVAAVLDSGDPGLMSLMLNVLDRMAVPESAEFIYFVAGYRGYPDSLRQKAATVVNRLSGDSSDQRPSPVRSLVARAREYEAHQSGLGLAHEIVPVWSWSGDNVEVASMTVLRAEEQLGLRAARQALILNPDDHEAKVVFLKIAIETTTLKGGIDREIPPSAFGALESALSSGPNLLEDVLDESIRDRRTAIALGAVRALAEVARPNMLAGEPGRSTPLLEALDYPNSRVRLGAALAALEIHPGRSFLRSDRVVETLAQSIDLRSRPAVLILDPDLDRGNRMSVAYGAIGYEPIVATSGGEGFKRASESGLIELLVIDSEIGSPDLFGTIQAFDLDGRTKGIPTVVVARSPLAEPLIRRLQSWPHIAVLGPIDDPKRLAEALAISLGDETIAPWSEEERRKNRVASLEWLHRIARGELDYLDIEPAVQPLIALLPDGELGPMAADVLAYVPGSRVQDSLALVALDESLPDAIRTSSALALANNIRRSGPSLAQERMTALLESLDSAEDPELRRGLARVTGTIDVEGKLAADRLGNYRPTEPSAEPAPENSTEPSEDPLPDEEQP